MSRRASRYRFAWRSDPEDAIGAVALDNFVPAVPEQIAVGDAPTVLLVERSEPAALNESRPLSASLLVGEKAAL